MNATINYLCKLSYVTKFLSCNLRFRGERQILTYFVPHLPQIWRLGRPKKVIVGLKYILFYRTRQNMNLRYDYLSIYSHFIHQIHQNVWKCVFFGPIDPILTPVVPQQQGAKLEIWPKWSKKVGFAHHRHLFAHKHRLITRFLSKTAKIRYFPIFSIVFYSKMPLKQRQRYPAPQDKVWIKSIMVFNLPTHRHSNPKRSTTRPFVEKKCHVWNLVDKTV